MKVHPIRGSIALLLVLATISMTLLQIEVPAAMWGLLGSAVTFYFTTTTEA